MSFAPSNIDTYNQSEFFWYFIVLWGTIHFLYHNDTFSQWNSTVNNEFSPYNWCIVKIQIFTSNISIFRIDKSFFPSDKINLRKKNYLYNWINIATKHLIIQCMLMRIARTPCFAIILSHWFYLRVLPYPLIHWNIL